jgi:pimeloyl-ACP methyl ester carboxylesterase
MCHNRNEGIVEKRTHRIDIDGTTIAVVDAGPLDGEPVLFLHGWPDSSHLWRFQIDTLAARGYRCVAPDLRGFGASDRPVGLAQYHLMAVAGDVLGVLSHLGIERCRLVGHDWGAIFAWGLAGLMPHAIEQLAVMCFGHPESIAAAGWEQWAANWWILWFLNEGVPEAVLPADDWKMFRVFAQNNIDVEHQIAELSRPGALDAALNYERANVDPLNFTGVGISIPAATCPTLGIWADGDHFATRSQIEQTGAWVTGSFRFAMIEGAGHWFPTERPDVVSDLLINFFERGA